jgi:hypothetical protein
MLSKKNYYTFTPNVKTNIKSSVAFDMVCIIKRLLVGSVIMSPSGDEGSIVSEFQQNYNSIKLGTQNMSL